MAGIFREEYLHAVELARVRHDPASDWEGFRETLWAYLVRVFGVEDGRDWPEDLPDPAGEISGDARHVAAWMQEQLERSQRSSSQPGSNSTLEDSGWAGPS